MRLHRSSAVRALSGTTRRLSSAVKVQRLHLLLYNYVDDVEQKRTPFRSAHIEHAKAAQSAGELALGGALAEPLDGAVLAFAGGAEAAERFATSDPYVLNGLVTNWTVREWSVVAGSLLPMLPSPPLYVATYEWSNVADGGELPAGLEVELSLDGRPARARIPPTWQLAVWVDDARGFWRCELSRETTVAELRRSAAKHASCSPACIGIRLGGTLLSDADATAEDLDVFGRQKELTVTIDD